MLTLNNLPLHTFLEVKAERFSLARKQMIHLAFSFSQINFSKGTFNLEVEFINRVQEKNFYFVNNFP